MSTVVSAESSTVSRAFRPVASWMRWVLIVWWFLSAAAVMGVGERPSTLPALLSAVDAGQVSEVQVVGALPPGAEGFVTQDVRWRQDGLVRHAEVRYASAGFTQDPGAPSEAATSIDVATVVHPLTMLQAEKSHRAHAIVEQVIADLKASALAQLPSGSFAANGAWLVLASIAFNLTRAAGGLASVFHAKATTATIRRQLITVPGRLARSARRLVIHPATGPGRTAGKGSSTRPAGHPPQ